MCYSHTAVQIEIGTEQREPHVGVEIAAFP